MIKLTPAQELIMQGKICPYCKKDSEYIDSIEVYGVSYGLIYICRPCNAWVGVHKSRPLEALGRLANSELREAKKKAHAYFDPLWKEGHFKRGKLYNLLSLHLGIPSEYTHIGMASVSTCEKIIEWCKDIKKQIEDEESK